jgi:hypothetical protein
MSGDTRTCSKHKTESRPEARFCDGCGTPLSLRCAGDKVLATRSSLEGERKQEALRLHRTMDAEGHVTRLAGGSP